MGKITASNEASDGLTLAAQKPNYASKLVKAQGSNGSIPVGDDGLSYKQLLRKDAMLWAEFLYSEYKRHKALLEEAQPKPTYYEKPDA